MTDVRAMTFRPPIRDIVAISSSVIPSTKYSSAESGLMFENGSTAIRLLSNRVEAAIFSSFHGMTILYTSMAASTFFRGLTPRLKRVAEICSARDRKPDGLGRPLHLQ